jgi:hypothetical protein
VRHYLLGIARLLAVAALLSGALYGLEQLFGWTDTRSVAGAVLFVLGVFLAYGTPSGSHIAERARAGGFTEHDIRLLGSDIRKRFGAGVNLMIVGAAVFCLAVLFA